MIKYSLLFLFVSLHETMWVNTKPAPTVAVITSPADPFLMPVEDVFSISGRGTVVTGKVVRGMIKTGDSIDIVGMNERAVRVKVKAIEMFRKVANEAKEGEQCGLILSLVMAADVKRGMVLAKPGSLNAYKKFTAEVIFKTKQEGGKTLPVADNYRPQFLIYGTTFSGVIKLPPGMQNITPAQKVMVTVEMETPVAVEKDLKFGILEGGREIGTGIITAVIKN